jgi:hypothetical protein
MPCQWRWSLKLESSCLGNAQWKCILNTDNLTGGGVYLLTMKAGSPDYVIEPTCVAGPARQQ